MVFGKRRTLAQRGYREKRSSRERASALPYNFGMDLTPTQMETAQRLLEAGFRPVAIALYATALCMHRGEFAAVLAPVANGGLRLLAPATVMIDGNLSVHLKKNNGDVFVWKGKEVAATQERLAELGKFRQDLEGILELAAKQ
jgi:hypothetical protein